MAMVDVDNNSRQAHSKLGLLVALNLRF